VGNLLLKNIKRHEAPPEVIKKNGHPPIANKVVLVDFDGTLYPFGFLFDYPDPLPGAVEAMQYLSKKGYRIVIFTSRLSRRWLDTVGQTTAQHRQYIESICARDGINVSEITCEKIPAEAYIDDKAIQFKNNWDEIMESI
jgi:hypothetical protein